MRLLSNRMLLSIGFILSFLFLLYPSSPVNAQTGKTKFTGVVSDAKDNPLKGVTVQIKDTQRCNAGYMGLHGIYTNFIKCTWR